MNCPTCVRWHYKCDSCWRREKAKDLNYQVAVLEENVNILEQLVKSKLSYDGHAPEYNEYGDCVHCGR
jgi:hypothetical protein